MDIYETKRQQILMEIKILEGVFPKNKTDLNSEQLAKIANHAHKYGHSEAEVLNSVLLDSVAYRAIVGKDPGRMDYYETALVEFLSKQKQVKAVQKLPKGGTNAYHVNAGKIVQGSKTKLIKSLDILIEFQNGQLLWVVHKFTKEGGGAQDAAFRDAELTLQQVQLPDGKVKINLAAVLDGDYYKQLIEKGSLSRLDKAKRDAPMTTVATYDTLISETKHIWSI